MPAPVVFIHGMFMNPQCWENWIQRFEGVGRSTIAPAWPGHEGPVEALRAAHPDPTLANVGLQDVVEAMADAIAELDEAPVLVAHSMGGLVAQLLLQRGVAVAAVAIDSAPPSGVFTSQPSFLRSNWPMISPTHRADEPHMITFDEFAYSFANTLDEQTRHAFYERYMVPESRRIPRDSIGHAGHVDFAAPHPPLLLTAGEKDHIIPAALNVHNLHHYRDKNSVTDFVEFPGRDHLVAVEPGWEEVADHVLEWLERHGV